MPLGKGQFGPSGEGPQNPLPPLDTESGAKGGGSDTRDQAAREATDTQIELSKLAFAQIVQDQDALVAQFKETEAQKIEALKAAAELQEQTEQSLLDKEAAGYARDSLAFQQVQDKKQILAAQFTLEMSKLDDQMAASNAKALQKTQAEYKSFFDTIDKSMDSMLQGVLQGTQSWQAAMAKLFDNLAISFVEDITKMLIKAAALQAVNLAGGAGGNLSNAIGAEVPRALGGTQDNASNPLTAAVTALTTALGLTSATQTAATAISQTTGTVVTGLSVATAANTTATIANTGAEGAGGGGGLFSSLLGLIPAFESGTTFAPGGLSILHPGEIVIPQAQSAALRSGGSIGGAAGAASGAQINFTVQAIDTQSGMSFLQSNAGNIASIIAGQIRNGNSSLINAVKN
jgi:hypothetical protein